MKVLMVPPEKLRALIIVEADLGERVLRALIMRGIVSMEAGGSGPVLIGPTDSTDVRRLENFLGRNGDPHHSQASASARIENYLGFPNDISGGALTGRAYVRAQKFGAEMLIPAKVVSMTVRAQGRRASSPSKSTTDAC
ncbi:hypothetical protein RCH10_005357 [Variovorax sp. GrIS 2.14]|uniref:hypothetical protein n=1 Tax=Variovorax sp. GrIS 2.14 TaxID=3071709 RepID=UPI0038F5DF20